MLDGVDDFELVPIPSREAVLADLEVLATDFGRLFATDCECHLQTDRDYWPSRFTEPDKSTLPKWFGPDDANEWDHIKGGDGLNVEPTGSKTPEDYDRSPVFYDRTGRPFVNSVGQSLITAPGWEDSHEIKLRGPGSLRAAETIERANDLVIDAAACFAGVLWPGWALSMRGFCWPNVVDRVAELAKQSTLKPSDWYVKAGGQSYNLDVWRRRDEFRLGGPMVAPEIAERIGDDPEHVWAVRRAFLRDAELAAQWLIERLAQESNHDGKVPSGNDIASFSQAMSIRSIKVQKMTGNSDSPRSLILRFRHLAGELRRANGHKDADREFERLLERVSRAFLDAYVMRRLPAIISDVVDQRKSSGLNAFWEYRLALTIVGYWEPFEFVEPREELDEGTFIGGGRSIFLVPGPVSLVWPGVFEDILCDARISNDADVQKIFATALVERQFTIMGYYATACDLLAEWIENHADDDQGDQPGDQDGQSVDPFPNDGLDKDGKAFEWGGRRFDQLTGGMMRVLELLHDERKKGHPNVPVTLIRRLAKVSTTSGTKSQIFKLNREGWPPIHPVIEIVIDNGDATYRLIDPEKVQAKVPDGS